MSQQINLYDAGLRRRREWLTLTTLAATTAVLLLLVIVAGALPRRAAARMEDESAALAAQSKDLQQQLVTLGQQLASRKANPELERQLTRLKTALATRTEILALLKKGLGPQAKSFADYLGGLARRTPHGLWLTGFTVDGDGGGMEIRGRTLDPALVAEYVRRLNAEAQFQGESFAGMELEQPAAEPLPNNAAPPAGAPAPAPGYHEFSLKPSKEGDTK